MKEQEIKKTVRERYGKIAKLGEFLLCAAGPELLRRDGPHQNDQQECWLHR